MLSDCLTVGYLIIYQSAASSFLSVEEKKGTKYAMLNDKKEILKKKNLG